MASLKPHVLVIPYPAQGHVIPLMELARYLVKEGLKVTFVNTEFTHKLVTSNWLAEDGFGDLMQMVSIPDGLEPWDDRSDISKLTFSILETMPERLEQLIETINKEESNKITCVISDGSMGWPILVAKKMGIRSAGYWTAAVATLATVLSIEKLIDDGSISENGTPLNDSTIQLSETMPPVKPKNLAWACFKDGATAKAIFKMLLVGKEAYRTTRWFLCNSTTELEPAAFSMYPQLLPIGPLLACNRLAYQAGHLWKEDPSCLDWLDQQRESSVIYISFGSFTMFDQTQFAELARGIELSNRPFLWVVRPGLTEGTAPAYPDGYIDRVGTRGRIVSWAPQQKVLAHPSVACFMSHCGWNSTLEGVSNGLPFLCWPYFSDQFLDETYICDIWKTGLRFKKDEDVDIINRDEIKDKIEQILSDKTFRDNALVLKENVARSVRIGGESRKNLKNFIEWIREEGINAEKHPNSK